VPLTVPLSVVNDRAHAYAGSELSRIYKDELKRFHPSRTFGNKGKKRKGPGLLLPRALPLTHVHTLRRGFLPGSWGTAGLHSR
jgi:hypothetical protein